MTTLSNTLAPLLPYAKWALWLYPLFCLWITSRIARRWTLQDQQKAKKKAGGAWFSYAIVFILISFLTMGAVLMPLAIGERISLFATGQQRMATVTAVQSREEQVTREDDDRRSYTVTVMMHTPVYTFTLPDGPVLERLGDIKSESAPVVGHRQMIFYDAGRDRLVTASVSNGLMLGAGVVFSFFLVLAFYATLRYAFGRNTAGVFKLMGQALMRVVVPLAMLLMATGLGHYAWQRFATDWRDDDPAFVGVISGFFAVTLLFLFVIYMQKLWASRHGDGEPAA